MYTGADRCGPAAGSDGGIHQPQGRNATFMTPRYRLHTLEQQQQKLTRYIDQIDLIFQTDLV